MGDDAAGQPPLLLDVSVQSSRFHVVAGAALNLRGICVAVGAQRRELLRDADLSLSPGSRVALVGRNGSGKSLLLKVLASGALLDPDAQLLLRAQLVTQSFAPPPTADWTVADEVAVPPFGFDLSAALDQSARAERRADLRSGRRGKAAREAAVAAAAAAAGAATCCDEAADAYGEAAAEPPSPAETLAAFRTLGIPAATLEQPWASLSGGWRMRVVLAKAVLYAPSLLLLDEPTNHLDIAGINHLIALLRSPHFEDTTIVFVSHDLHFVNALAQSCLHLQDKRLKMEAGNWDEVQRARREQQAFSERYAAEQERARSRLLSSIDESLRGAGRDDKLRKQLASRRDKALERDAGAMRNSKGHRWKRNAAENAGHHLTLLDAVEVVREERPVHFRFDTPDVGRRAGADLLSVDSLAFAYPNAAFSLRLPDLCLAAGERLVLLGPNGHGKSTLLRLFAGELPARGAVRISAPSFGYFEQHAVTRLGGERRTALQYVADAGGGDEANSALGRFGLGAHGETPVALLSGGQRVALEFVVLALKAPALLLLDEPSAHLDLQAREALALALASFEGAAIFVSHDVGFIELARPTRALVCVDGRFTAVEADGWKRAALDL